MSSVALVSVVALFRTTLSSADPLFAADPLAGAPRPVPGIWAVLPTDCASPQTLNLANWPRCAIPIGILDDEVAALQRPQKGAAASDYVALAKTKFVVAPGAPEIVQIDVPTLFSRTSLYVAVVPDGVDAEGRFTAASGWPVGCPAGPVDGVVVQSSRCTAQTQAGVRTAAQVRPEDARVWRLVRVTEALAAPAPDQNAPGGVPQEGGPPAAQPPAAAQPGPPSQAPAGPPDPTPVPPM